MATAAVKLLLVFETQAPELFIALIRKLWYYLYRFLILFKTFPVPLSISNTCLSPSPDNSPIKEICILSD
jgi:hypothetical protein